MSGGAARAVFGGAVLMLVIAACGETTGRRTLAVSDGAVDGATSETGASQSHGAGGKSGNGDASPGASGGAGSASRDGAPPDGGGTGGSGTLPDAGTGGSSGHVEGGSGGKAGAPVVSGTRLKARYVQTPDGARILRRGVLFDSDVDTDCSYRKAADGKLRCLPVPAYVGGVPMVLFKDAGCTDGAVWLSPPSAGCPARPPAYALDFDSVPYCALANTEAELPARVYKVGEFLGTVTGPFYRKDATTSGCTTVSSPPAGTIPYALEPEVAPTTFVLGTETLGP